MPPVGKSGAFTIFMSFSGLRVGSSMSAMQPSTISVRLCGGILVAMPTAIPLEPLISRFGRQRRQDRRLGQGLVEVGNEIDRVLLEIAQHLFGKPRQTGFGVPHGRRRVPVDRPEIPLPVHQRIAHGKILGHADHGIVDRAIAMGVVFSQAPRPRFWRISCTGGLRPRPRSCMP